MITPSYGLTATERVLPALAFDFTTGTVDPRITCVRAGDSTRTNSSGVIELVAANTARIDYDPVTLACKGLLIETGRTNLFLNSLINGTSLATQTVATNGQYTLSFYGTGSIAMTGGYTGTLTGTGAYPSRVFLTVVAFTSTVFTVTGTVQYAQLELSNANSGFANYPTSFIPTAGASATRAADVVTVDNLSPWFNSVEGTLMAQASTYDSHIAGNPRAVCDLGAGTTTNRFLLRYTNTSTAVAPRAVMNGTSTFNTGYGSTSALNTPVKQAMAYKSANSASTLQGYGSVVTETTAFASFIPTKLFLGTGNTSIPLNGHIQKVSYWKQRLTNNEMLSIVVP
jgi:hypothetical protein